MSSCYVQATSVEPPGDFRMQTPGRAISLADEVVSLEPLSIGDEDDLLRAVSGARDSYALTRVPATNAEVREYVEGALAEQARGLSVPFTTRDARTRQVVGSTRFMNIERWAWPPGSPHQRDAEHPDAVEIGATWLAPEAQRTGINTHAKLLMLTHAFERWEVRRVTLKTDARNARSRAAIERLGARFDGVLRANMPAFDGGVRDTAFYSILREEWPEVAERLRGLVRLVR
jgi:RimJ/RimL family protein N-acetyltransferase